MKSATTRLALAITVTSAIAALPQAALAGEEPEYNTPCFNAGAGTGVTVGDVDCGGCLAGVMTANPIYFGSGQIRETVTDFVLPGPQPQFRIKRSWGVQTDYWELEDIFDDDRGDGLHGWGWASEYQQYILLARTERLVDGGYPCESDTSGGVGEGFTLAWYPGWGEVYYFPLFQEPNCTTELVPGVYGELYGRIGAQLIVRSPDPSVLLEIEVADGTRYKFETPFKPETTQGNYPYPNYTYEDQHPGRLEEIVSRDGRSLDIVYYSESGVLRPRAPWKVIDSMGRCAVFRYSATGEGLPDLSNPNRIHRIDVYASDPVSGSSPEQLASIEYSIVAQSSSLISGIPNGASYDQVARYLRDVTVKTAATPDTGTQLTIERTTAYRYRHGESDNRPALEMIIEDEDGRRAVAAGVQLATASGETLEPFATRRFEYPTGDAHRPTKEFVKASGCCGGAGEYAVTIHAPFPATTTAPLWGLGRSGSIFRLRSVARPNGSPMFVATDYWGNPIVIVEGGEIVPQGPPGHALGASFRIAGDFRARMYEYDYSAGSGSGARVKRFYTESAIRAIETKVEQFQVYDPSLPNSSPEPYRRTVTWYRPVVDFAPDGLVYDYDYLEIQGQKRLHRVFQARATDLVASRELLYEFGWGEYALPTIASPGVLLNSRKKMHGSSVVSHETYSYAFWTPNATSFTQTIKCKTTTRLAIPGSENGSGIAAVEREFFDQGGNLRWKQEADGSVSYYAYDINTGLLAYSVRDVFLSATHGQIEPALIRTGINGHFAGWSSSDIEHQALMDAALGFVASTGSASSRAQIATSMTYDALGRVRSMTTPGGQTTWTAYLNDETRVYPSWDATAARPRLPMSRTYSDFRCADGAVCGAGGCTCSSSEGFLTATSESVGFDAGVAPPITFANPPTGSESWSGLAAYRVAYSMTQLNNNNRISWSRVWRDPTNNSLTGAHIELTKYDYEIDPDPNARTSTTMVRLPNGVWEKRTSNMFGLLHKVERAVETSPDTEPAEQAFVVVALHEYGARVNEGGQIPQYYGTRPRESGYAVQSGQSTRVTYFYDWRGDLKFEKVTNYVDGASTLALPIVVRDYDLHGNVTAVAEYVSETGLDIDDTTGEGPSAATRATNRVALEKSYYNVRDQLYKRETYAVDRATGAASNPLVHRRFYDAVGRLVVDDPPNDGLTITQYDGAGREIKMMSAAAMATGPTAMYNGSGAFLYGVASIQKMEQSETQFDAAGRPIIQIHREINHSDTDGLSDAGTADNVATYAHTFYDAAGRVSAVAYYGTNAVTWSGAAGPTYNAGSIPARSDDVLVTSYLYDTASRVATATDPKAINSKFWYDGVGLLTKQVEDHGGLNRTTEYFYDLGRNLSKITAKAVTNSNGTSGLEDQVTEYVRNDPVDADLVTLIKYPDPTTGAAGTTAADQVSYEYFYDGALKRKIDQRGVAILYEYDAHRRVKAEVVEGGTFPSGVDSSVARINYLYDSGHGRLNSVSSYASHTGGTVLNQAKYEYDNYFNVIKDSQDHDGAVGAGTPAVERFFEYAGAAPSDENWYYRVNRKRYPNGRNIWYGYAHATSGISALNGKLSRVAQIADGSDSAIGKVFAEYSYNGLGRTVLRDYLDLGTGSGGKPGNKYAMRGVNDTQGYIGFDRFGRTKQIDHVNYLVAGSPTSTAASLGVPVRQQYWYDRNSNRTETFETTARGRTRFFAYDNLDRLTSDKSTWADFAGTTQETEWAVPELRAWTLDVLGNWDAHNVQNSGVAASESRTHNSTNEIVARIPAATAVSLAVNDDFTDGDQILWGTPDVNNDGLKNDGSWAVSNAKLTCTGVVTLSTAPGGAGSMRQIENQKYQDVRISVELTTQSGAAFPGIVFAYQNSENYWVHLADLAAGNFKLYEVTGTLGDSNPPQWALRASGGNTTGLTSMSLEVRSGSVQNATGIVADYNAIGSIPAGWVGVWSGSGSSLITFDNFKVQSLAADNIIDGRFFDDVATGDVNNGMLVLNDDLHRSIVRHVALSCGIIETDMVFNANQRSGVIFDYADPENFSAVLFWVLGSNVNSYYVDYVDGKTMAIRYVGEAAAITQGVPTAVKVRLFDCGTSRKLQAWVGGTQMFFEDVSLAGSAFSGGRVGILRNIDTNTGTLSVDRFKVGFDTNNDNDIADAADRIYADYDFEEGAALWERMAVSHDHAGNMTNDGLFQYTYDAWNRLTKVYYAAGDASDAAEAVAVYAYDGMGRRLSKTISNQGLWAVPGSTANGAEPISAGDRVEHYYYDGWELVERRGPGSSGNGEGTPATGQWVYGVTRIDEPLRYDRNTDPSSDGTGAADDCIESTGSRAYFYHEEANTRVVMLSDEAGLVAERCDYSAYGEPQLRSGTTVAASGPELGAARRSSAVGNPLLHQGLFRDDETGSYQNRYRQYLSGLGRFGHRDPLGYVNGLSMLSYLLGNPLDFVDPMGLRPPGTGVGVRPIRIIIVKPKKGIWVEPAPNIPRHVYIDPKTQSLGESPDRIRFGPAPQPPPAGLQPSVPPGSLPYKLAKDKKGYDAKKCEDLNDWYHTLENWVASSEFDFRSKHHAPGSTDPNSALHAELCRLIMEITEVLDELIRAREEWLDNCHGRENQGPTVGPGYTVDKHNESVKNHQKAIRERQRQRKSWKDKFKGLCEWAIARCANSP